MSLGLLWVGAILASAAEAPYFEGFDTVPPNGVPANFVETPDSAWQLSPGTYVGSVTASGGQTAAGTSISLTNVAGHNFTVRTKFRLQTNGGFDFRLADMSLIALANNPDVTSSGYQLRYYASGLLDVYGKVFLGGGYTTRTIGSTDSMVMTLHGAYIDGSLYLTGSLDNGSRILTVSTFDSAPSNGSYFGLAVRAAVSNFHFASLTGYYDDFSVKFETQPVKLGNIAARVTVGTRDDAAVAGFIISGNVSKRVLLVGSPVFSQPYLSDPILELRQSDGSLLAFNDNWRDTQEAEIYTTGLEPSLSNSAAIITLLKPGAYTAVLRGKNEATGIGLIEVYDVDAEASSKLSNASARGQVGTGDNALIAGVIVSGDAKARVIVRALGPSLAAAGIEKPLVDPILELRDRNGALVRSNDNWRDSQETEIMATSIPPTNEAEAAIVADLLPTNYTAIVRGKNDTTGTALVEVYHLN